MASTPTTIDTDCKLMLHFEGADASTTFTDSEINTPKTGTAQGNAQIDTAQFKFGSASGLFDGSGDWVSFPDSADFNFGTGNLTIDFWVRFNSLTAEDGLIGISNSSSGQDFTNCFTLRIDGGSSNNIEFRVDDAGVNKIDLIGAHGMSTGTWYHVALIRGWGGNANDWAICINGTAVATTTASFTVPDFTSVLRVGDDPRSGNSPLNGWMDELRIVKGTAVWTANFTSPSAAYTAGGINAVQIGRHPMRGVMRGAGIR